MLIIYLQVQTFKMHWQKPIIQVRDRERERERENLSVFRYIEYE